MAVDLPTTGALPTDTLETDVTAAPSAGLDVLGGMPTSLDQLAHERQVEEDAARQADLAGTQVTTGGISQPTSGTGARIIQMAEHYLGTPYVWGGDGPSGVDCSGLVQMAYRAAGINLPRISYQQANSGTRTSIRALRPGDLVAWDNSSRNAGADHIAIYLGAGRIIEAARPGTSVRIRMLGNREGAYGVRMGWN